MIGWRFEEALALDTCEAVTRWWAQRGPSPAAPIPDGLVEDLQTARLALDEGVFGIWPFSLRSGSGEFAKSRSPCSTRPTSDGLWP
jgi:hypothetical protein